MTMQLSYDVILVTVVINRKMIDLTLTHDYNTCLASQQPMRIPSRSAMAVIQHNS